MANGNAIRLCFVLCLWTVLITAARSSCPLPRRAPLNGYIVYRFPHHARMRKVREDYVLRFKCSPGYTLRGAEATLCSSDQWTHNIPSCIKMQCEDPPAIKNGQYELNTGAHNGPAIDSTARYSCDPGYQIDKSTDSVLTCVFINTDNAEWNGTLPNCQKLESCSDPGVSSDGTREGRCCFIGDVLQYSCNDDFELEGEEEIQCLAGGNWSSPRPLCRPFDDHCDLPPIIPHGFTKGEKEGDFFRPYDEVEVLCEPGFKYEGSSELVMCEEEYGWEDEFNECTEFFCDTPKPLANGTIPEIEIANITSFPYNFDLTYICDEGFRLVGGDSWRSCDIKGWSDNTPHCEVITCPDPGNPDYGSKVGSSFGIGDKVIFKCFTGYDLIGSFERYCMPNGQWSGELTRCDISDNYCPEPGIPINGVKSSTNYDMGEKVNFRCQAGFTLLGTETRECLPNRTWSGGEVKCLGPYDFDSTVKVGDILKVAIAEKREEQRRKLEEYNNAKRSSWFFKGIDPTYRGRLIFYFAFDVSGSVKEHNFRKSVDFAKAIVKKIGITENGARAGALTFSSKADTQFLPLDYNSTEEVVEALDRLNYTGGGTSASSALSTIREVQIPLTQARLPMKGQKSIIFILTDGKANMGGHPQEEAELLKAAGVEIYCVGITNTVLQQSLFKIASDPKEEHVFILRNYPSLLYLIEEITKGVVDYSMCGLGLEEVGRVSLGRIVGGKNSTKPWPWMAALYSTHSAETEMICGGSIIHERFILTAAHCLYKKKDWSLRETKNLVVKLGLTDTQNQTKLQEFEVENALKYPHWTGQTFNHDIALLKLKRPIQYNALVRPICLPPDELTADTPLYKPKEYAVAIGWGHTEVLEEHQSIDKITVKDLKEVILPIQPIQRCKDSLIGRKNVPKFTDSMFCAGDGEGGNDTCQGDSGGPLMQSQLNKDGYIYWTQVGVVSWGPGCGLPNAFGYYTHVQKVVRWINEAIQNVDK